MTQVRVFGRPDNKCTRCGFVKRWLDRHGVQYQFTNVDDDPAGFEFIQTLGAREVPVVVWNQDSRDAALEWFSGASVPNLERLLDSLQET